MSPKEIIWGMLQCFHHGDRLAWVQRVRNAFSADAFVCLSVRSGFDLLLKAVGWPAGSEIIMSGLTIPDMPRIVRKNGLVPIGVDLELNTLCPSAAAIEAAITQRTRAVVVAHLFGGRANMSAIIEVATKHNLMVIEDCAQAFVGDHYRGDSAATISMFSFGPIKTNSALGGAIFCVRHRELLSRLNAIHENWPLQSRHSYFKRLAKYALIKFISTRPIAWSIQKSFRLVGKDHDQFASKMARGFPTNFFTRIRQRPSEPLLRMMHKKLIGFDQRDIAKRAQRGLQLARRLGSNVHILAADRPTFWVFTILVNQPRLLVESLWRAGFDATTSCSLRPVTTVALPHDAPDHHARTTGAAADAPEQSQLPVINAIMQQIVFLPFDNQIPASELKRLADLLLAAKTQAPILPADVEPRPVAELTV